MAQAMETDREIQAVGRRKTSVARVFVREGSGEWSVNGRSLEDYFPREHHRIQVLEPLRVTELESRFHIVARVDGGGVTGQADALRMALARAAASYDEDHRPTLRRHGLLTRDSRKVERKKPGQPKARKKFQFSKR